MITLRLGQLVQAEGALTRLGAERLPALAAYRVARLIRAADAELSLYRERRDALIRELGAERPPTDAEQAAGAVGPVFAVKPEAIQTFVQQLQPLEALEITLPVAPVPIETLGTITVADAVALGPLVTGD